MKYKDLLVVGLLLLAVSDSVDVDARSTKHKNELEVQTALTIEMDDFKEFQLDDAYPTPEPIEDKTLKTKPDVTVLPEFDPKSVSRKGDVVFKGDPRCSAHPECCVNRRGIGFVIASLAKCGVSNYVEHPSLNLKAVPAVTLPESSTSTLQVMPYNALTDPDQI